MSLYDARFLSRQLSDDERRAIEAAIEALETCYDMDRGAGRMPQWVAQDTTIRNSASRHAWLIHVEPLRRLLR